MTEPKRRTFKKFTYRGIDLDNLLSLKTDLLVQLIPCRIRRKFNRGLRQKSLVLIKRLRKAKSLVACTKEKPIGVKTHLRDTVIVPDMIGSILGIYNGKTFNGVEIKPEMIGNYTGEFSLSYKPVSHGRPGINNIYTPRPIPTK